jgi:hypothetical protein
MTARHFAFPEFEWWLGVVEDVDDPEELGRVRIRAYGYHTDDLGDIPKDDLPWAVLSNGVQSSSVSGLGHSPTGIVAGTSCWGFWADGKSAQFPILVGTFAGKPGKGDSSKGFNDPEGKYPTKSDESDVNRLSRGVIKETVVEKTKADLDTAKVAHGGEWEEPPSKYSAKYPDNHVFESLSGHVFEVDDTEGAERLSRHHRKGTFEEIHPDGTRVHKVVKDSYTIVYGNDFLHVRGNVKITVDGDAHLLVGGNADVEVKGNVKETIHGNYRMEVKGSAHWSVKGDWKRDSETHISDDAPRIDHN